MLPRDSLSVPVARRVLNASMRTLGVAEDCLTDIEIALTEACTNVLDHAADGDEDAAGAGVDDRYCVIEVVDPGRGFDADRLDQAEADPSAEEGRGIQLIRALVDRVHFRSRPERGMIVHLAGLCGGGAPPAPRRSQQRRPPARPPPHPTAGGGGRPR